METVLIQLDAGKLKNPDLDIRYALPERIEEYTGGAVSDNGYDFINGHVLGIWLSAADAEQAAEAVIRLLQTETFLDNDLSAAAEVWISEEDSAAPEQCRKIYPAAGASRSDRSN